MFELYKETLTPFNLCDSSLQSIQTNTISIFPPCILAASIPTASQNIILYHCRQIMAVTLEFTKSLPKIEVSHCFLNRVSNVYCIVSILVLFQTDSCPAQGRQLIDCI